MMYEQRSSRKAGTIYRIYKNADKKILAFDDISIQEEIQKVNETRFFSRTQKIIKRTYVHETLRDRVIAVITVMGDYSSISEDFSEATWANSDTTNNIVITFEELPVVGDTI
jgi:hypothetical protein